MIVVREASVWPGRPLPWPLRDEGHPSVARGSWRRLGWRCLDVLVVAWLFLANGALLPLLFSDPGSTDLADATKATLRLFVLPSMALAVLLTLIRPRAILDLLRANPLLVLVLIWVWCSLGWSVDPGTSARRALALAAFTAIAGWLVVAYEPAALLRRLSGVLMAQLALSLILALALPRFAYMPDGHLLRGIFLHKNVLGQALVFAAILCLLGWELRFLRRATAALGLGLVLLLAGMAGSASAILLVGLVLALRFLPRILALPGLAAAALLLLLLATGAAALLAGVLLIEPLLDLLGRDLTLTGRTDLWAYAARMIELRPLLGYGYAAFFDLPSVAIYVTDMLGWSAPNAHNGYLEVALGLGLPGLALVTLFLLGGVAAALRSLATGGRARGARIAASFSLLYLTIYLTRNLVESDLLSQAQLSWTLAVVAVLLVRHEYRPTSAGSAVVKQ